MCDVGKIPLVAAPLLHKSWIRTCTGSCALIGCGPPLGHLFLLLYDYLSREVESHVSGIILFNEKMNNTTPLIYLKLYKNQTGGPSRQPLHIFIVRLNF